MRADLFKGKGVHASNLTKELTMKLSSKWIASLAPLGLLAAAPLASVPAMAAQTKPEKARMDASIPFANHGGVDDWRADGTRTVYFRDLHNQWYKAELMGTAFDLPFVEHIGIISGPNGSLDRFGGIVVKGQRYTFSSFEKVAGPPVKAKKGEAAKTTTAAQHT